MRFLEPLEMSFRVLTGRKPCAPTPVNLNTLAKHITDITNTNFNYLYKFTLIL
jgi:hypothetical protein